jgi:hypothetical protein
MFKKGTKMIAKLAIKKFAAIVTSLFLLTYIATGLTFGYAQTISSEQAIATAGEVATALDVPFGEGATAVYTSLHQERPEWLMEFQNFSRIRVADDGKVISIINYSALSELPASAGKPSIPETEAIQTASQALNVLGVTSDLKLEKATLVMHNLTEKAQEWEVTWQRIFDGIPYEKGSGAYVNLNAATGKLIVAHLTPPPPPPASTEVKVSEEEAIASALSYVREAGKSIAKPRCTATLEIAQPGFSWRKQVVPRYDDPSLVIWRVEIGRDTDPTMIELGMPPVSVVAQVQIDAASGEVVGDALSGLGPAAPAGGGTSKGAEPKVKAALPTGLSPTVLWSGLGIIFLGIAGITGKLLVRARRPGTSQ